MTTRPGNDDRSSRALLLGIGNLLWADEGFGVRCVEAIPARYAVPENVVVADGGTQGLYLVDYFRAFDPVVVFDAVDFGGAPGELAVAHDEAIPRFVGADKMSLHQVGLQDVIACAQLLGGAATHMLLVGVQPVELEDYGGSLRPAVRARVPHALAIAAAYLKSHGFALVERDGSAAAGIVPPGLELGRFEAGRPGPTIACRHGDARVLARRGGR